MRCVFFIGLPLYNMLREMSYKLYPHFLLLLGLNFINGVHAEDQVEPGHIFASKVDKVPSEEFYDSLTAGEVIWFAGLGLSRLEAGEWHKVFSDGRYTALAHDPKGNTLWYAGPRGIGLYKLNTKEKREGILEAGYIWDLHFAGSRVWFVGSSGYGWLDAKTAEVGLFKERVFLPRPFVIHPEGGPQILFVSSEEGLCAVDESGCHLVIPIEETGQQIITWAIWNHGTYMLGTAETLYRWDGRSDSEPVPLESNYPQFFEMGISNAVGLRDHIAILEFPNGVVFLNRWTGLVETRAIQGSGLAIGDSYKIEKAGEQKVLVLGKSGVGTVDLDEGGRFFPNSELWPNEIITMAVASSEAAFVFTDRFWARLTEDGGTFSDLPHTAYWAGLDAEGRAFHGALTGYKLYEDGAWVNQSLEYPAHDLVWGRDNAFALTNDGLHVLSRDWEMSLILPGDQSFQLLGDLNGEFFVVDSEGSVFCLKKRGSTWTTEKLPIAIPGKILSVAVGDDAIHVSTGQELYRLSHDRILKRMTLEPGWEIVSLAARGDDTYAAFHDPLNGRSAIGIYSGEFRSMLAGFRLDVVGEVSELVCNETHMGLVGRRGFAWHRLETLQGLGSPEVNFKLLFQESPVDGLTLPSGMHFIDLQVAFLHPEVPGTVQYRINEQRWRNLILQDPTLQFAGHGNFSVELRAVHPNGMSSPVQVIQFGIAPPWYLNPWYQGLLLVLAMGCVWLIYALRHAQLKRTNLWLQDEVRKQTKELEEATAARTNFLAGLSHDIRNPLNGVLMIAETLTRDPPKTADDSRLNDLTEFGIIVDRMLGEILDFSAIDQSNMPMAYIPVSVNDILTSSVRQNQFSVQKALVNLTVNIPAELKEVIIKTDRNWMIKILTNLIVNALEYSESERIEVGAVCHRLTPNDVEMELYVKDWGIGIDDAEKRFVFDRFYRGESGIESGKHGTGLGLSICQEIAHAMGAHLSLTDNDPSGCCFVLKGRFERVAGAKELDREAILQTLNGKRVLVVDDLSYNRRAIVDFFKTIGCVCDECENGKAAVEMLGRNPYDLALLDWDLPGLMGPDIARRHRKAHPSDAVILIALTAYTDGEKRRESVAAGMNGYISKPLTASRLAYCLANIEVELAPVQEPTSDAVNTSELNEEIYNHVRDCLLYGERYEWENLRRCAHRLTTLALMKDNRAMQQVCRNLQLSAKAENLEEIHVGLAELQQWGRG